jgi:hypothetical protein
MKFRMTVFALLACAAGTMAQVYSGWGKYKQVAINTKATGANVTGAVTNFPVLIRLTVSNAADIFTGADAAMGDGADIRVSTADGLTAVPYELERYDTANKVAEIWALASSVAGNDSVNAFRVYWKKPGSTSASSTNVFTSSNGYVGAWQFGNASSTDPRPASVAGAPPAIIRNGLSSFEGLIGKADSLGPTGVGAGNASDPTSGRYVDLGRNETFADRNYAGFSDFTAGFSYSIWLRIASHTNFARIISMAVDSTANVSATASRITFLLRQNSADPANFAVRWTSAIGTSNGGNLVANNTTTPTGTASYDLNQWTHMFVTKAGGTSAVNYYKNGVLFATTSGTGADAANTARNSVWIGRTGMSTDGWLTGLVDHTTLSTTVRSADFIKLSYETQKAGAIAVTLGTTENGNIVGVRGALSPALASFSVKAQGAGAIFRIAESSPATVSVMDLRGQVVWSASFAPGARELAWNGAGASSGLYVARLTVAGDKGASTSVDRRLTLAR